MPYTLNLMRLTYCTRPSGAYLLSRADIAARAGCSLPGSLLPRPPHSFCFFTSLPVVTCRCAARGLQAFYPQQPLPYLAFSPSFFPLELSHQSSPTHQQRSQERAGNKESSGIRRQGRRMAQGARPSKIRGRLSRLSRSQHLPSRVSVKEIERKKTGETLPIHARLNKRTYRVCRSPRVTINVRNLQTQPLEHSLTRR